MALQVRRVVTGHDASGRAALALRLLTASVMRKQSRSRCCSHRSEYDMLLA
jgi:hypothetical protein